MKPEIKCRRAMVNLNLQEIQALNDFRIAYGRRGYKCARSAIEKVIEAWKRAEDVEPKIFRECDRFPSVVQSHDLHAAFAKHCNECDCPMGCIHRRGALRLLDARCSSIMSCFARFVLSKATRSEVANG